MQYEYGIWCLNIKSWPVKWLFQSKPIETAATAEAGDSWADFGASVPSGPRTTLPSSILEDLGPSEDDDDEEDVPKARAEEDDDDETTRDSVQAADIRIEAATSSSSDTDGEDEPPPRRHGKKGGDSSDTESGSASEDQETSSDLPAAAATAAAKVPPEGVPDIALPPEDLEPRQLKKLETMRESPA